jgi:hypothetical protein
MSQDQASRSSGARAALHCPRCGSEMNRHAVKIDTRLIPEPGSPDEGLGGVMMEFLTCLKCRYVVEEPC